MTDTSKDAVARLCLAMINSGNTTTANILNALADERDRLATAHTQLMQSLDAANARADQARDAALVEAAKWHVRQAEAAMGALHCGSENSEIRAAGRVNDMHREAAHAILALRDSPEPV